MFKESASGVLYSFPGTVKRETMVSRGAATLFETGSSQGEEPVSADLGREGEISARVWLVRGPAFPSFLRPVLDS